MCTINGMTFRAPLCIRTTSDSTGTLVGWNTLRQMPDIIGRNCYSLSWILVLTPNGQLWDCATIAFSERYNRFIFVLRIGCYFIYEPNS